MLNVAIWSRFPEKFIQDKIEPGLEKRGIRITKYLSDRTKQIDLSSVSAVLYLHELTSHAEYDRIKNIVLPQGIRLVVLSRKASQWEHNLRPLLPLTQNQSEVFMAQQHAIPDENVSDLCNAYKILYIGGIPRKEMIAHLRKFWQKGELTNPNQLDMQMKSLISTGRAPAEFQEWYKTRSRNLPQRITMKEFFQETSETAAAVSPSSDERDVLNKILEEEAEKFSKLQKDLETKMAEANRQLSSLRQENERLRKQSLTGVDDKIKRVTTNIVEAVELNLMSKEEAFTKLSSFIKENK